MTTNQPPLVSVVMAVYNGERYVQEAIDSILNQTFTDFELIVVDDASTDSTPALLAGYADRRVCVLRNEKNLGPYGAANRGIAAGRSEIIARHDADDRSHPERFTRQVQALKDNPTLVLVGSSYRIIDHRGEVIDTVMLPATNAELQKRLERGTIFIQGAIMIRRLAFERVEGYRQFFPVTQDYDLFLRLAEVGEIANLDAPLYDFRFHGESISRNKKELQLACRRLAWELASRRRSGLEEGPIPENVVEAYPPEPVRLFSEARGTAYLYYAAGRLDKAGSALARALTYLPQLAPGEVEWPRWIVARAQAHAANRTDVRLGAEFIEWIVANLPPGTSGISADGLLSKYYIQQAFAAYQAGNYSPVFGYARAGILKNRSAIKNRGLLKIAIASIFKRRNTAV